MRFTGRPRSPRQPGSWSLALRLTALFVGSSFAILLIATLALYLILIQNLRSEQNRFLQAKLQVVREMLMKRPDDMADLEEEVEQTWAPRQFARVYVRVLDADGNVMVESPHMDERLDPMMFPAPLPATDELVDGITMTGKQGNAYRATSALAQIGNDPDDLATLQVALDTENAAELLEGYRRTLLLVLGAGLALCGCTGYWLARAGLKPLRQIAETSGRIRSTNLAERIKVAGLPGELHALALRFNEMLDRLEDSFGRLSRFSADLAHELRTPVNNVRMGAEVALSRERTPEQYRETLASCLEECDRVSRIVESLLFIARAEDPRTQIPREDLDVSRELRLISEFFEVPASEAGVELVVSCAPAIHARLDRMLFQRAISNLVSNAIRYTPPGGRVALSAARENGELRVEVNDTGAGIAPEGLVHIFDRFYRADAARSTSAGNVGLGLAIVKSIVTLHGGQVAVRSKPGTGTSMILRIPASADDHPAQDIEQARVNEN